VLAKETDWEDLMGHHHLSIYQRKTIAIMLHDKDSPDTIARSIGCDKSTVSETTKCNLWHVRKRSRYSVAYTIEHAAQKQEVQAQKTAGDP
jgi:IS30 family transposase